MTVVQWDPPFDKVHRHTSCVNHTALFFLRLTKFMRSKSVSPPQTTEDTIFILTAEKKLYSNHRFGQDKMSSDNERHIGYSRSQEALTKKTKQNTLRKLTVFIKRLVKKSQANSNRLIKTS